MSSMHDLPSRRYHVTVTAARDGEYLSDPAAFAPTARHGSGVISAQSAEHIITAVTVETSDRAPAVAVALSVVLDALRRPVVSRGQ